MIDTTSVLNWVYDNIDLGTENGRTLTEWFEDLCGAIDRLQAPTITGA